MSLTYLAISVLGASLLGVTVWAADLPNPLHVRNTFEFTVQAPPRDVAPLFGAHRERVWAEGWEPQFLYPQPAEDRQGAIFTVKRGDRIATWVTTVYEPDSGHIQHVYFVADIMVTLIDIHLFSSSGPVATHVKVAYERTALRPELNEEIRKEGELDAQQSNEWREAIEKYLQKTKKHRP